MAELNLSRLGVLWVYPNLFVVSLCLSGWGGYEMRKLIGLGYRVKVLGETSVTGAIGAPL